MLLLVSLYFVIALGLVGAMTAFVNFGMLYFFVTFKFNFILGRKPTLFTLILSFVDLFMS
jgi:hypothetical protein